MPREAETVRIGEKLGGMLAIWGEGTDEEKAKIPDIMLDAVYWDLNKRKFMALKPKSPFPPVFALCG